MIVNIEAKTNGKGKNTVDDRTVLITKLELGYSNQEFFPGDPYKGELRAYFDPYGFVPGSWNVEAFGYICGDRQWIKEFKEGLRKLGLSIKAVQNVRYNDLELQKPNYVSLEIDQVFYASWKRLEKEMNKNEQTAISNSEV